MIKHGNPIPFEGPAASTVRQTPLPWRWCSRALTGSLLIGTWLQAGCGAETYLVTVTPTPDVTPITVDEPENSPPDWTSCTEGYQGFYYNLPVNHPDVEPTGDLPPETVPGDLDWWDEQYAVYDRYDQSLDFGVGWFPVEQGFEGDPLYFAAHWQAWIRVKNNNTPVTFSLGAATDLWVQVGDKLVSLPGIQDFDVQTFSITFNANQYPLEIYFAQRAAPSSGLRVRITGADVRICYPDYE